MQTHSKKTNETDAGAVSRREFVKSTTAVAGAMTLPAWAFGSGAGLDTIRVGLIGCGGRGTGAATQALKADPGCTLTALGDAFEDRIDACLGHLEKNDEIGEKIRVQDQDRYVGFDAYKHVIDSGVDVVLLATPPVFRPAHLRYAIERDKHVFTEKPMAVDAPGVRSVLETARLAKEKNRALVAGFCWRYNLPQRELYRRIQDGQIGEIRALQTTYNSGPLNYVERKPGWSDIEWQLRDWQQFTWLGGDHIVEQAVHAIDWIHWAMSDLTPAKAFAVGGRIARKGEASGNVYDHFGVFYEFENGARGYHMCRQIPNCANDNTAFFMGTKGTAYSNPWAPQTIRIEGENPWRYKGPNNDMYQQEHDELFASIRSGDVINDGEWMAHSTMMGIMGRMVAYTGQALTYDQCLGSEESLTPSTWSWGDREFPEVAIPGKTKFR